MKYADKSVAWIAEIAPDLADRARETGHKTLTYLLELVALEAVIILSSQLNVAAAVPRLNPGVIRSGNLILPDAWTPSNLQHLAGTSRSKSRPR